jgi:uncharacterized membrane protein YqjE
MSDTGQSASPDSQRGLFAGLGALFHNAMGLVFARAGLAALELAEARDALIRLLLLSACGLLMAGFALILWSALLIYLTWSTLGWSILLLLAILYTGLAWLFLRSARAILEQGKLGMPATIAELRSDREALFGKPHNEQT